MNNESFQKIKRKDFAVIINGEKVLTPEFTKEGTSNFRFTSDLVLQKQCYKCKKWYDVAKYENKEWIEIWSEEEYKKSEKTGLFSSYCTKCNNNLKGYNSKKLGLKTSEQANNVDKNTDTKKDTVLWDMDVYKYIMIQAVLQNKSKNKFLNDIFIELMKSNPLSLFQSKEE